MHTYLRGTHVCVCVCVCAGRCMCHAQATALSKQQNPSPKLETLPPYVDPRAGAMIGTPHPYTATRRNHDSAAWPETVGRPQRLTRSPASDPTRPPTLLYPQRKKPKKQGHEEALFCILKTSFKDMKGRGGASSSTMLRWSNTPWWEGWEAMGSTLVILGTQQIPFTEILDGEPLESTIPCSRRRDHIHSVLFRSLDHGVGGYLWNWCTVPKELISSKVPVPLWFAVTLDSLGGMGLGAEHQQNKQYLQPPVMVWSCERHIRKEKAQIQ